MRISNIGLMVKDLEGAKKFFEEYFGATVHAEYSEDNGYRSYIMKFDENPKIELMSKPEIIYVVKNRNDAGYIHICIKVDSKEKFDEILSKTKADGYEILYEPDTVGGQEFRAIMLEDNIIEVCY